MSITESKPATLSTFLEQIANFCNEDPLGHSFCTGVKVLTVLAQEGPSSQEFCKEVQHFEMAFCQNRYMESEERKSNAVRAIAFDLCRVLDVAMKSLVETTQEGSTLTILMVPNKRATVPMIDLLGRCFAAGIDLLTVLIQSGGSSQEFVDCVERFQETVQMSMLSGSEKRQTDVLYLTGFNLCDALSTAMISLHKRRVNIKNEVVDGSVADSVAALIDAVVNKCTLDSSSEKMEIVETPCSTKTEIAQSPESKVTPTKSTALPSKPVVPKLKFRKLQYSPPSEDVIAPATKNSAPSERKVVPKAVTNVATPPAMKPSTVFDRALAGASEVKITKKKSPANGQKIIREADLPKIDFTTTPKGARKQHRLERPTAPTNDDVITAPVQDGLPPMKFANVSTPRVTPTPADDVTHSPAVNAVVSMASSGPADDIYDDEMTPANDVITEEVPLDSTLHFCKTCGVVENSLDGLRKHEKEQHPIDEEVVMKPAADDAIVPYGSTQSHNCATCGVIKSDLYDLLNHQLEAHQNGAICPILSCGRRFDAYTQELIVKHLRRHAKKGQKNENEEERAKMASIALASANIDAPTLQIAPYCPVRAAAKASTKSRKRSRNAPLALVAPVATPVENSKAIVKQPSTSSKKETSCRVCGKVYKYAASLAKHIREHEGNTDNRVYEDAQEEEVVKAKRPRSSAYSSFDPKASAMKIGRKSK